MLLKCAICSSKNSIFIKKQEASGILNNLGLKTPLKKIPLLSFFEHISIECNYKFEVNSQ